MQDWDTISRSNHSSLQLFSTNLNLEESFHSAITSVTINGQKVDIKLLDDPGRSPVFIEYTSKEGVRKRIKASATGTPLQYSCELPTNATEYFAFVVLEGIKHPYPINGQVSPIPIN